MGLAGLIQQAVQTARIALDDVFLVAQIASIGLGVYDAESGTSFLSNIPITVCPMLFARYKAIELANTQIDSQDQKVLIAALDAPGLKPEIGDLIKDPFDDVWEVKGVGKDPTTAVWILQTGRTRRAWPI